MIFHVKVWNCISYMRLLRSRLQICPRVCQGYDLHVTTLLHAKYQFDHHKSWWDYKRMIDCWKCVHNFSEGLLLYLYIVNSIFKLSFKIISTLLIIFLNIEWQFFMWFCDKFFLFSILTVKKLTLNNVTSVDFVIRYNIYYYYI